MPEALERLAECYLALGLTDEARATAAVLGYNYPGSKWYGDAYALVTGSQEPDAQAQRLVRPHGRKHILSRPASIESADREGAGVNGALSRPALGGGSRDPQLAVDIGCRR